jgi:hypothetical protein
MNNKKYLYKYRAIKDEKNLDKDLTLKALFAHEAVFSSRKMFNDLFDSKIDFIEIEEYNVQNFLNRGFKLKAKKNKDKKIELNKMFINETNKMIDAYIFYSLSANPVSNLMWAHYSNSHRGFCIEFKKEDFNAQPITYSDEIAKLDLNFGLHYPEIVGKQLLNALQIKLKEWSYEEEYRFFANNEMTTKYIHPNNLIALIPYPPIWVESLIFGCKMPESIQKYIMDKYPVKIRFKKAIERKSSIEIVEL